MIASQQQRLRRARTLLLLLADRQVCTLADSIVLALGVETSARDLMISAERQGHILKRRQLVSNFDADLAARRIADALSSVRYVVQPQRRANIFEVVGYVNDADKHLLVALKFVAAAHSKRSQDEWWVQTAYPLGTKRRREMIANGHLRPL